MLSPRTYVNDCLETVGQVINHVVRGGESYQSALQKSQALWKNSSKNDTGVFQCDFRAPVENEADRKYISKITYNIKEAATRQKKFYYQGFPSPLQRPSVSRERYDNAMIIYKTFLYLKQQQSDEFIVPCYKNRPNMAYPSAKPFGI